MLIGLEGSKNDGILQYDKFYDKWHEYKDDGFDNSGAEKIFEDFIELSPDQLDAVIWEAFAEICADKIFPDDEGEGNNSAFYE